MGNFKPLMPFGETTVLQSILHLLKAKQVTEIAVVTGYRAEEMNYALQQEDITSSFVSMSISTKGSSTAISVTAWIFFNAP